MEAVLEKTKAGYVYLPGEGETLTVAGESITFKAVSEDTQGAWALIEFHVPPHFAGPPLHWHKAEHEAFYVLLGTVTLQIEERVIKAPAGSFVLAPPGVVHTFSNKEEVPTSFLGLVSPGGWKGSSGNWPPRCSRRPPGLRRYE